MSTGLGHLDGDDSDVGIGADFALSIFCLSNWMGRFHQMGIFKSTKVVQCIAI